MRTTEEDTYFTRHFHCVDLDLAIKPQVCFGLYI